MMQAVVENYLIELEKVNNREEKFRKEINMLTTVLTVVLIVVGVALAIYLIKRI
jgi:phosphate starvation-inducible membrane PsiE